VIEDGKGIREESASKKGDWMIVKFFVDSTMEIL